MILHACKIIEYFTSRKNWGMRERILVQNAFGMKFFYMSQPFTL